jgi:hypothetical protein
MTKFLALPIAFLTCLFGTCFASDASDWVASRVSGQAWIAAPGGPRQALTAGSVIPDGNTIGTGRSGRVRLTRDLESIIVSPGTVLTPEQLWWGGTTILQPVGQIELEVEKRNVKHFSVETPFLAAVVKGTHFSVQVSAKAAAVSVSRGMVSVADFRSGQSADITPGQRAAVSASGTQGLSLSGLGKMPAIETAQARAAQVGLAVADPAGKAGVASTRSEHRGAAGPGSAEASASSNSRADGSKNGNSERGGPGGSSGKGDDGGGRVGSGRGSDDGHDGGRGSDGGGRGGGGGSDR